MSKKRSRAPWKRPHKWRKPTPKAARQAPLTTSRPADAEVLARLAEGVWRLKRRVHGEGARDWAEPIIAGLSHDLHSLGVEIIDRTGTLYNTGESTEVVHNDAPAEWKGRLAVTDVVRPTIRVGGVIVERGQIVLGPHRGEL